MNNQSSIEPVPQELRRAPPAYERYMLLVAVLGNAIFYIQAAEIVMKQSAEAVSYAAFSASVWALSSWLVYGLLLRNRVLVTANIIGVLGAILVLVAKWYYS